MKAAAHVSRTLLWAKGYRSKRVDTAAGPVHYMVRPGEGPHLPIVLLHGLGSAGAHYGPLLRHLRKHVQKLTIVDFPGHGFSRHKNVSIDAELFRVSVEQALDQIITEPVILYGNSLGGLAAIRYSVLRPKFVKALIACSPGGAPMTEVERDSLRRLFDPSNHEACLEFVDRLLSKQYKTRHMFGIGVKYALRDETVRNLLSSLDESIMFSQEEVSQLSVPTLCVWGKEDGILPKTGESFFRRCLPDQNTRFSAPADFGHSPHLEYPRRVARQIIDFARDVAEST